MPPGRPAGARGAIVCGGIGGGEGRGGSVAEPRLYASWHHVVCRRPDPPLSSPAMRPLPGGELRQDLFERCGIDEVRSGRREGGVMDQPSAM